MRKITTMKPSDEHFVRAAEVLRRLVDQMQPASLATLIDEPIDRAVQGFAWPAEPVAPSEVPRVLAAFLQHVYRQAFANGPQLSLARAHDELVALLQADAQDPATGGYVGAMLDATVAGASCWEGLAARVITVLKTRLRRQQVQGLLTTEIEPQDWPLRCALTSILIQRLEPYLPSEITAGPPERWAGQLTSLLGLYMGLQDQPADRG